MARRVVAIEPIGAVFQPGRQPVELVAGDGRAIQNCRNRLVVSHRGDWRAHGGGVNKLAASKRGARGQPRRWRHGLGQAAVRARGSNCWCRTARVRGHGFMRKTRRHADGAPARA
eukprot:1688763-Pleurochrysis_carterae.AAC.1